MDRKNYGLKNVISVFLSNIPSNIRVKAVFLFGSHSTGKARKDSDIDLVIISPDFKNVHFMKRLELLSHVQGANPVTRSIPMDIIGYTPEEFKNIGKESAIMRSALRKGRFISI